MKVLAIVFFIFFVLPVLIFAYAVFSGYQATLAQSNTAIGVVLLGLLVFGLSVFFGIDKEFK